MNATSFTHTAMLGALVVVTIAAAAQAQRPKPKETTVGGHTMYAVLKPGDIPAIFDPLYVPVREADSMYFPDEPMLAVAHGGEAKAYSIWHLDQHEIVNDFIGKAPHRAAITVTW